MCNYLMGSPMSIILSTFQSKATGSMVMHIKPLKDLPHCFPQQRYSLYPDTVHQSSSDLITNTLSLQYQASWCVRQYCYLVDLYSCGAFAHLAVHTSSLKECLFRSESQDGKECLALTVLPEDRSSIPRTHSRQLTNTCNSSQGPLPVSVGTHPHMTLKYIMK